MTKLTINAKNSFVIRLNTPDDVIQVLNLITALDKTKIASTLIHAETKISHLKASNAITISKVNDVFTYPEIEKIIHHIRKHSSHITNKVYCNFMGELYNTFPDDDSNIIHCISDTTKLPLCNIRLNECTVFIHPVNDMILDNNIMFKVLSSLTMIDNCKCSTLHVLSIPLHQTPVTYINELLQVMHKYDLLNHNDLPAIRDKLIRLALNDVVFKELKVIRSIKTYPSDHPLSQYKELATKVESILSQIIARHPKEVDLHALGDAIYNNGYLSGAPAIITKSFNKLRRDFGDLHVLHDIITRTKSN